MTDTKQLAADIRTFLAKYGKKDANEPLEWNSPDAAALELAAGVFEVNALLRHVPHSEWGSGGYYPYTSKEGKRQHDDLIARCALEVKPSHWE